MEKTFKGKAIYNPSGKGKHYQKSELEQLFSHACNLAYVFGFKVYFKDSFVKQSGINRLELPEYCVQRDFKLHEL
jgi:hypothetical protein